MLKQKYIKLHQSFQASMFIKDTRFSQVYDSKIKLYLQSLNMNKNTKYKIDYLFKKIVIYMPIT